MSTVGIFYMPRSISLSKGRLSVAAAFPSFLTRTAGAALLLCTGIAQAQTAEKAMPETVVTATRSAISVDETLADVAVITSEQIESMAPARSTAELLQRLAGGVQLSSNGGRGATQSVFLRGTAGTQTLLLIDGVRYGSATSAAPVLENIPLELIDRIEVVKGPASALYGSEAIGGVIQVFTKRGSETGKPFVGSASITAGENGYKAATAALRGEQNGFDYSLGVNRLIDHGFSATNAKAGLYTYNPDRDGFRQTSVNLGVGYAFNKDWRVDTKLLQSEGRVFTDSGLGSNPYADMKTQVANLKVTGKVLSNWTTYFSIGQSKDKQANFGTNYVSHFNTTQTEYKWDNEIATGIGTLLAGVERLEQKVDVSSDYTQTKRNINAVFVGLNGSAGAHSWQANLRRDDNSQYGGMTTYGLSYGYEFIKGLRAYVSHGKSMRAPSFNDLYYPPDPSYPRYNGNPYLKPEQAKNNEIGLQWQQGIHRAKLLHFNNGVTNLIASGDTSMTNLAGTTRLRGWSLEYGINVDGWGVSANYDYLDAKQANNQPVTRRARNQFALNVDKRLGAWKLGGSMLYVSSRKDIDYNTYDTVNLPSYTTLDLYAEYRINPEWSVQARVANVGNKHYETAYGFNQLGRAGYLTLKWAMR